MAVTIPPWLALAQNAQVNPGEPVMPGQIPPLLRAPEGQAPADAAPVPNAAIKQMPVVQPQTGLESYLPKDRAQDDAGMLGFQAAHAQAKTAQEAELAGLNDYINQLGQNKTGVNWTPLAAYIDSQVPGSKMTQAAQSMAPMSEEDKAKMLFELKNKALAGRAQLAKGELDSLRQQTQMQQFREHQDGLERHNREVEKAGLMRASSLGGMVDSREKMQAQRQYLNDRMSNTYKPRLDGAVKILKLMDSADRGEFKANSPMLGQLNAEIARLETGSQSPGLHASEKTEMLDAAAALHNYVDTFTGKVTGVDMKEKFTQARGMVNDLMKSYKEQIDAHHEEMLAGATPNQIPIFQDKIGAFNKSVEERMKGVNVGSGEQKSGPHGPTVIQNGHTYNWNPQTGRYE